jgi:hypothetical protein
MLTYLHQLTSRALKAMAAGVLVFTLVFVSLPGTSSQAQASTKGTLPETMDLEMTKAAQEYVESILDEYSDVLEDSFSAALKPLKSVTKDLTKQLSKAAKSPTPEGTLDPMVESATTALDAAATTFDTLVADTAQFKTTLTAAPDQLKAALDTQLGTKFDDLQQAFDAVSEAIATLSSDTTGLDAAEPAEAMTSLTEHSSLLTEAIESAKTAISAFGD